MGTGVGAGRYYSGNKSYKLEVTDNCLTLSAASRYGRWGDFLVTGLWAYAGRGHIFRPEHRQPKFCMRV